MEGSERGSKRGKISSLQVRKETHRTVNTEGEIKKGEKGNLEESPSEVKIAGAKRGEQGRVSPHTLLPLTGRLAGDMDIAGDRG